VSKKVPPRGIPASEGENQYYCLNAEGKRGRETHRGKTARLLGGEGLISKDLIVPK